MFEFIASVFAMGIVAQVVFWVLAGLLFPVFWIWMLIDAALRRPEEYPRANNDEKVIWIVLLILFQIACLPYFFMVYRRAKAPVYGAAGVASI